jgi:hypothetical protein
MFNDGVQAAQYPAQRGVESFATLSRFFEGEPAAAAVRSVKNSISEKDNAKR